ncbi:hypothetical protein SASPL_115365 [Salvia splendens]|uniref:Uncharacterized protein n=1 Tax=Salvia splendens TaxID=180675 RepID=A0A8X8Y6F0_SALSN|nr:hypothetical protein SASPL_115365 [Salvia splendens]
MHVMATTGQTNAVVAWAAAALVGAILCMVISRTGAQGMLPEVEIIGNSGVIHVPVDAQGRLVVRAGTKQHVPVQLHARGFPYAVVLPVHPPGQSWVLLSVHGAIEVHQVLLEHRQAPVPLPQRHRPLGEAEALHAAVFQYL